MRFGRQAQFSQLVSNEIAENLKPTYDLVAAIHPELEPGAYTEVVSGINGATGVGIVCGKS